MVSQPTRGAERHPPITFFVLAYALSWWPSILYVLELYGQPVAGFGPFLAALAGPAVTRGRSEVDAIHAAHQLDRESARGTSGIGPAAPSARTREGL